MGKTETGTVWLSAERTSPYQFYQYWIRVEDADAGKLLRTLTKLPREEIESLDAARSKTPPSATASGDWPKSSRGWCTAKEGLAVAQRATDIFFGAEISNLNDAQLIEIFADVPSQQLDRARAQPMTAASRSSTRWSRPAWPRAKATPAAPPSRAARTSTTAVSTGVDARLTAADLASETVMVLRSGKKNYALLRFAK